MGSTRGVLIALVLLAGIGLVIWQLANLETHEPPEVQPHVENPVAAEKAATSRPESTPAQAPVPAIVPKPFVDAEIAAQDPAASKPKTDGRRLVVVLAPKDKHAAGAVVELTPTGPFGNTRGHPVGGLVADDRGVVRIPAFKGFAEVRGTLGNYCGRAMLGTGDLLGYRLRLAPGIAVLVVDAAGAPQSDVPVSVLVPTAFPPTFDRAMTGADGLARLAVPDAEARGTGEKKASVALAMPLDEPVEAPFDPELLPESPVRLVLPQTGTVVVRLVTPDRQPFLEPAVVELQGPERGEVRIDGEGRNLVRVAANAGVATFRFVGLGPPLEIAASPANPALRRVEGKLDGPRAPGETALTLECGGWATTVSGRLVKSDGKAMARTNLEVKIPIVAGPSTTEPYSPAVDAMTGPDGKFVARFDVDPATVPPGEAQLGVKLEQPRVANGIYVDRRQAVTAALPDSIRTGNADLGDVIVADLDLVAAGKVVDPEGAPVGGARLRIVERSRTGWRSAWRMHEIQAASAADGRFELRGKAQGASLGLAAEREGWRCLEPVPFEIGARDVKLVMSRAGAIEGSIAGLGSRDTNVWTEAPIEVSIVKAGVDAPREKFSGTRDTADPDRHEVDVFEGQFECKTLRPGTYTVEFYKTSLRERNPSVLLVVEGIVVKAGETTKDPRLQNIELAKLLKSLVVTVVDERGVPLKGVRVGARAAGSSTEFGEFATGADGRATVATDVSPVEVIAAAKGYRSATLAQVAADATIKLEKTTPKRVTIRLAEGVELPAPPFSIGVKLEFLAAPGEKTPEDAPFYDPRNAEATTVYFGRERTAVIDVDDAGTYAVKLWLYEEDARGRSGSGLDRKGFATVAVGDEGGSVTVTADPDAVKSVLERKKRKKE